jgi:hypothetical protein
VERDVVIRRVKPKATVDQVDDIPCDVVGHGLRLRASLFF